MLADHRPRSNQMKDKEGYPENKYGMENGWIAQQLPSSYTWEVPKTQKNGFPELKEMGSLDTSQKQLVPKVRNESDSNLTMCSIVPLTSLADVINSSYSFEDSGCTNHMTANVSLAHLRNLQLKHGYGIEAFSSQLDYINLLSKKILGLVSKTRRIEHQTSTPRPPEQNALSKDEIRISLEAAQNDASASKLPLIFWV
ncbi:hypothetical protein Tco_0793982 [Tanacetum coccineum]